MNPFAHLNAPTFELLNTWSHIKNLEVLILEMSNMSDSDKNTIKKSLTLILCNFDNYFSSLKVEFAKLDAFIECKFKQGAFDKRLPSSKSLRSIVKGIENIKFRSLFDLPKFFIKTYNQILLEYADKLEKGNTLENELSKFKEALTQVRDIFISYEKFCVNFTCHLNAQFN